MARKTTRTKAKPEPVEDELEELDELEEDTVEEEDEPTPAPKKKAPAKKAVKKKAPEPEPEDDEDEDDELEDEDEDDEKPAKKAPPKRKKIEHGTAWLAEYINEKLGTSLTAYSLRNVIRKLARDGKFDREIGTDRDRYEFTGPKDPKAKIVLDAVKGGAGQPSGKSKSENLEAAREAKKAKAKKKAEAAEEVEELDDEIEEIEDIEDEDDE